MHEFQSNQLRAYSCQTIIIYIYISFTAQGDDRPLEGVRSQEGLAPKVGNSWTVGMEDSHRQNLFL